MVSVSSRSKSVMAKAGSVTGLQVVSVSEPEPSQNENLRSTALQSLPPFAGNLSMLPNDCFRLIWTKSHPPEGHVVEPAEKPFLLCDTCELLHRE